MKGAGNLSRAVVRGALWVSLSLSTSGSLAQTPPPPTPTPSGMPPAARGPDPADRSGIFPRLNVFLPEGRADIRLFKTIRNSLIETQIAYNFVSGDLSAFLRYKYYGRTGTSTFSFFDSIEFEELERFSNEFTRTRGALYLQRLPLDFYNRLYGLIEFDRLTFSNPADNPDANRTNMYVKVGYQYGTPSDERSNAVVGESRDRTVGLFTAYREIGPRGRGLSVAATHGFDYIGGDFSYVKTEVEALQAIAVRENQRLILRLHAGAFPYRKRHREEFDPVRGTPFSVPRYELFKLNGREILRGYRGSERGTNEVDFTAEYVVPVFTQMERRFLGLRWSSLFAIGYAGTGNVGNESSIFGDFSDYKLDAGVGLEASLGYAARGRAFLSVLAAQTLVRGTGGPKLLLSIRTYR